AGGAVLEGDELEVVGLNAGGDDDAQGVGSELLTLADHGHQAVHGQARDDVGGGRFGGGLVGLEGTVQGDQAGGQEQGADREGDQHFDHAEGAPGAGRGGHR